MAYEIAAHDYPFEAGEDLTGQQFRFVKVDTAGKVVRAGNNELAIGVLQNKPDSGQAASVRCGGISKIVAGGVITAGDRVGSDSQGRAKGGASAAVTLGIALDAAAAAGEVISFLHQPAGTP